MAKRYERYRKEYTSRQVSKQLLSLSSVADTQLYALYLAHRESPWFLERYSIDPSFIAQRRRVNRQGRVPTTEKYLDALRAGDYNRTSFDFCRYLVTSRLFTDHSRHQTGIEFERSR